MGSYIYILIFLKFLVSDRLYKVLVNLIFCSHIALMVVDKVYLLTNWEETFHIVYT